MSEFKEPNADVNLTDATAMVHGQMNKPRQVYFSEDCSILLTKLIENS
jgi:site-specific recombinase XerD